jgi:hypothetical protein
MKVIQLYKRSELVLSHALIWVEFVFKEGIIRPDEPSTRSARACTSAFSRAQVQHLRPAGWLCACCCKSKASRASKMAITRGLRMVAPRMVRIISWFCSFDRVSVKRFCHLALRLHLLFIWGLSEADAAPGASMGMCPAPKALDSRREDAHRPTAAPGSSRGRARRPLGKASRKQRARPLYPVGTL